MMCRRLVFLILPLLLLGQAAPASAADLDVPSGTTYTAPCGTTDYEEIWVEGVFIVPACATVTSDNGNSCINGGTLLVDGGDVIANCRFNIGDDAGGHLIIQNGGSFTQQCPGDDCDEGFKLPDNEPDNPADMAIIRVSDGTFTAHCVELISDRNGRVEIGMDATIVVGGILNSPPERYDPREWLANGDLYGIDGVSNDAINIEVDGETAIVTLRWYNPCAHRPIPAQGATGVPCVITDVVISWLPGDGVCELGRQYLFFGTDKDCVENAPTFSPGWTPPACYVPPPRFAWQSEKNMGKLPMWMTYYWRVDSKDDYGLMWKCWLWSFTTGCDPVPAGDVNLDCLVNFDDFALMLTTWGEEQFFPWD